MGYVIGAFGPLNAAWVPVIGMVVVVVWVAWKTNMWSLLPHPIPARV